MTKTPFVCIFIFLTSCTFETHVSGVIIDEKTGWHVKQVLVRKIKDLNGRQLEFAETKSTNDGHFDLRFSTKSESNSKVIGELSKPNLQAVLLLV